MEVAFVVEGTQLLQFGAPEVGTPEIEDDYFRFEEGAEGVGGEDDGDGGVGGGEVRSK